MLGRRHAGWKLRAAALRIHRPAGLRAGPCVAGRARRRRRRRGCRRKTSSGQLDARPGRPPRNSYVQGASGTDSELRAGWRFGRHALPSACLLGRPVTVTRGRLTARARRRFHPFKPATGTVTVSELGVLSGLTRRLVVTVLDNLNVSRAGGGRPGGTDMASGNPFFGCSARSARNRVFLRSSLGRRRAGFWFRPARGTETRTRIRPFCQVQVPSHRGTVADGPWARGVHSGIELLAYRSAAVLRRGVFCAAVSDSENAGARAPGAPGPRLYCGKHG